jgi:8-amino-7-oxononanoate synthase
VKHTEPPPALAFLSAALADLERTSRLRVRPEPLPPEVLSFSSNDYLGLASRPAPPAASGAGASRLVTGELDVHRALEAGVCTWLGVPAALTFSSGYAANVGALAALAGPDDVIISDSLNHASIIDGARLSRARTVVVAHRDLGAFERALRPPRPARAWVVTESYFGMDADVAPLAELRRLCDAWGAALYVDEAHALGVLGPDGRGLCAEAGVAADVLVGTFGKAFGASGAFVAGCPELVLWLWNRARSFVFSTGMSPSVAVTALRGLREAATHPELRTATLRGAQRFRAGLRELGVEPLGQGHVIPWVLGRSERAVHVAAVLRQQGLHVLAIRPPSVPDETARIRFTVTARHSDEDIRGALEILRAVVS